MSVVDAMNAEGHPVPNVAHARELIDGLTSGSLANEYTFSRFLGMSRKDARERPARETFLALVRLLGADVPNYDEIIKPLPDKAGFHFSKDSL